jgi:zinc protease
MRDSTQRLVVSAIFVLILGASILNPASAEPLGKKVVLDNGIVLVVSERPGLPMVVVDILIDAGSIHDTTEKAGMANLTSELLASGTPTKTAVEIAEESDFIGSSLSTAADYDFTEIELVVLKKYLEKGLNIVGDIIINPTFPQEEVENTVREIQGELKKNEEDPSWLAEREFLKALYDGHPYGRMVEGNRESLLRIDRADLINFHSKYYLPNRTIISIAGDITLEDARNLIEKNFGDWKKKEIAENSIPPPPVLEKTKFLKLDREVTQANIVLGHLGISRDNPDYYPLQVMNYILGGGGFSSRLVNDIRDKRGLAYSVGSTYLSRRYPGSFQVPLQTKNPSAMNAVKLVLENMRRIKDNEVSDEELEDAKAYLIGSLPLSIETDKEVAENMALLEYYHLGLDYFDKYRQNIQRLSKRDVLRVAQKYLHPDKYVLVIVGNLKKMGSDKI